MAELIDPSDKRLNLRSDELSVDVLRSDETRVLIDEMLEVAKGERDEKNPDRKSMVGLAAPQIGRLIRIIIIDVAADPSVPNFNPDLQVFVNPRVVRASQTEEQGREGCYSTGKICGRIWRPNEVVVEALNRKAEPITHTSTNSFQARIFQHEIDHLDGIRFPQRMRSLDDLLLVGPSEFGDFRKNWHTWKKLATWNQWLKISQTD